VATSRQLPTPQTFTVQSELPEAKNFPSGLKETEDTQLTCLKVATSHHTPFTTKGTETFGASGTPTEGEVNNLTNSSTLCGLSSTLIAIAFITASSTCLLTLPFISRTPLNSTPIALSGADIGTSPVNK
jgi:hypothetical protein